jgi:hypothetical protein
MEVSGQFQAPAASPSGEIAAGTHCIGDPRAGVGIMGRENYLSLSEIEARFLGRLDRSLVSIQTSSSQIHKGWSARSAFVV